MFVGNENINIEVLNAEYYSEGYDVQPISNSLNETTIIKGVSSFSYNNKNMYFLYATLRLNNNNTSNYILSFYLYYCSREENTIKLELSSFYDLEGIKGKYFSCFSSINFEYVHCCYINTTENNNNFLYTITIFLSNTLEII